VEPLILDASVLIGLLDTEDSHHNRAVDAVDQADQADHPLLTPASAYSEAMIAFARAKRLNDAREAIAGMGITVVPLTRPPSLSARQSFAPSTTRCGSQTRLCLRPLKSMTDRSSPTTSGSSVPLAGSDNADPRPGGPRLPDAAESGSL
jgi:hypothetical protein